VNTSKGNAGVSYLEYGRPKCIDTQLSGKQGAINIIDREMKIYNAFTGIEGVCYHKLGEELTGLAQDGGFIDLMQE
jgi:hypothetical protein